ncbi:MAG TPA: N-acetylneuraminate synthase family protein [Polyangiaceae bacterium]
MTVFVAEFTTNHMGNLNVLLRMVERAAQAGCSLIKMQKKDVETFYSKEKLDSAYVSPYGKTYRDYRKIFEFDDEDFQRFDAKCREHGVGWFCTVQDVPSLHFMLRFGLSHFKVASSNARNRALLEQCRDNIPTDREIVISVGGSTLAQVEQALATFPEHRIWLLHCVAQYPCPPENLRLGNIAELKRHFESDRVRIGYSGHEEGIKPSLGAIAMGAAMVERHFCLSRHSFVHHIECSLEPEEFATLVEAAKSPEQIEQAREFLPPVAFRHSFGMSDVEKTFLVEQTYGTRFIDQPTRFPPPDEERSGVVNTSPVAKSGSSAA